MRHPLQILVFLPYKYILFQVFVDLSTISAGESDLEVDRVLQMQAAVSAYAGFIFDLAIESTFQEFMQAANILFQAIKIDKNVPDKLLDSNRHLYWIKTIKEQHGSIEISSIQRVDAINATGVYTLDFSEENIWMKFQSVDVNSSKKDEYVKTIGQPELHELHSKLMLISKSDVAKMASERFISIFCCMLRLKEVGVKLCKAGCFLFSKMIINVFCDPDRTVKTEVNFGGNAGILKGKGAVLEEIEELVTFLEECFQLWTVRIGETRNSYAGLNYFKTKQLVQLSQDIALALGEVQTLSDSTESILKLIDPSLCKQSIIPHFQDPTSKVEEFMDSTSEESNERDLFEQLVQEGYSEELAGAALVFNGEGTVFEDLILWCVEHEEDHAIIEPLAAQFQEKYASMACEEDEPTTERAALSSITRIQEENTVDNQGLVFNIESVWNNFLLRMDTIETSDFLSFERLGKGLDSIISTLPVLYRDPPKYVNEGKPNLIVTKKEEIHLQILNLFFCNQSNDAPRSDEVLFLGQTTSFEDVELMMLRSFNDSSGRIYCIANCERLDFSESMQVEKLLISLKKTNLNYRLVFISSLEQQSYIKTALDKYRIPVPEIINTAPFNAALNQHLESSMSPKDPTNMRLLCSARAGMGKTLQAKRTSERLERLFVSSHLFENSIAFERLFEEWKQEQNAQYVYHLNISNPQTEDLEDFLFKMFVLKTVQDQTGNVWICRTEDLYLFELINSAKLTEAFKKLFPITQCASPREALDTIRDQPTDHTELISNNRPGDFMQVCDQQIFNGEITQRTVNNLLWFDHGEDLDRYEYIHGTTPVQSATVCLETLLKFCPVDDPSFCELNNFAAFLNLQLKMAEQSTFTNLAKFEADWRHLRFKNFVVKFLIFMAQDFSTRSVDIAEEGSELRPQITERRRWENSNHPYIFFNADNATLSFLGLEVNANCDLVDERNTVLIRGVMTRAMRNLLLNQAQGDQIPIFNRNFDNLTDKLKLASLCRILGQNETLTPDPSYKITSDNVKKLLAIRTRFMCNMGVVVMGETGCGKTRMVKFLCDLMNPAGQDGRRPVQNLFLMKVHGGVTAEMIYRKVREALLVADENKRRGVPLTVLFFDEANTTR